MNDQYKMRALILLALAETVSRAINHTAGDDTAAIVNDNDIQAECDNMALMALNKQLKIKGKI